jgi:hypothetical protein
VEYTVQSIEVFRCKAETNGCYWVFGEVLKDSILDIVGEIGEAGEF